MKKSTSGGTLLFLLLLVVGIPVLYYGHDYGEARRTEQNAARELEQLREFPFDTSESLHERFRVWKKDYGHTSVATAADELLAKLEQAMRTRKVEREWLRLRDWHQATGIDRSKLRPNLEAFLKEYPKDPDATEMLRQIIALEAFLKENPEHAEATEILRQITAREAETQRKFVQLRERPRLSTPDRRKLRLDLGAFVNANRHHFGAIEMLRELTAELERPWKELRQRFEEPMSDLVALEKELRAFKEDVLSEYSEGAGYLLDELPARKLANARIRELIDKRDKSMVTRLECAKELKAICWLPGDTPQSKYALAVLTDMAAEDLKPLMARFDDPKADRDLLWRDMWSFVETYGGTPPAEQGRMALPRLLRERRINAPSRTPSVPRSCRNCPGGKKILHHRSTRSMCSPNWRTRI